MRQHLGTLQRGEQLLADPVAAGEDRPLLQPTGGDVEFDNATFGYGYFPTIPFAPPAMSVATLARIRGSASPPGDARKRGFQTGSNFSL